MIAGLAMLLMLLPIAHSTTNTNFRHNSEFGCILDGHVYQHGDIVYINDCVTICRCESRSDTYENSEIKDHQTICRIMETKCENNCENPLKIRGICCPVCPKGKINIL
jgi:hypothetical protein